MRPSAVWKNPHGTFKRQWVHYDIDVLSLNNLQGVCSATTYRLIFSGGSIVCLPSHADWQQYNEAAIGDCELAKILNDSRTVIFIDI